MSDTVKSLKIRCAELGTTLTNVCRNVGVHPNVMSNWAKEEPKSIRTLKAIEAEIERLAKEQREIINQD